MDACLNENKSFNAKLVGFLFENTKDYPILHSSHILQQAVCKAISMNVPGIHEFLSSRMVKSPQLSSEWLRTNDLNADKKLKT